MSVSGWKVGLDPTLAASESGPVDARVPGRSRVVAVRLSEGEYAAWKAAAAGVGRGQVGRWVRETVTAHLAGRGPVREVGGVGEVRVALTRIGTNLNQIARGVNAAVLGGPAVDVRDVLGVLTGVRKGLAGVRDALRDQVSGPGRPVGPGSAGGGSRDGGDGRRDRDEVGLVARPPDPGLDVSGAGGSGKGERG